MDVLSELGASEIVAEEFETSIEILSRVLRIYHVPRDRIDEHIRTMRQDGYVMLRYRELAGVSLVGTMAGLRTEIFRIERGAAIAGQTLAESRLRASTGAAVVAVKRGEEAMTNPGPDTRLEEGDVVLLLGTEDQIAAGAALLQSASSSGGGSA
jgi:CPA2 family monovalent cation:H+ antiporter-2